MTDKLITLTLEMLFTDQTSPRQRKQIIEEFELMGNAGEYPVEHYVKLYLPENLKARAAEATKLLLAE